MIMEYHYEHKRTMVVERFIIANNDTPGVQVNKINCFISFICCIKKKKENINFKIPYFESYKVHEI